MTKEFFCAGVLCAALVWSAGCSDDAMPRSGSSGARIASLADDMRKCAPDIASLGSGFENWTAWSGAEPYGVIKKHFDSTSGIESIYATVTMLDDTMSQLGAYLPAGALQGESGSKTVSGWTCSWEAATTLTLPSILNSQVVNDFAAHVNHSGDQSGSTYVGDLYYKPEGDDGIEKIYYRYDNGSNERGLVYAERRSGTGQLKVWTVCHKAAGAMPAAGSAHVDSEFRCLLNFEGNSTTKTFKFRVKTDAAEGWLVFGGGSTADDNAYIALRGTSYADTSVYANNGTSIIDNDPTTSYVILTFGELKNATAVTPKYATAENFATETESVKNYIILGEADCPFSSLLEIQAFKYPAEKTELGY